eukprot:431625-Amphidinium_carterae.1
MVPRLGLHKIIRMLEEQSTLLYGLDMMEKERERIEKEQHEATWTISNLRSQVSCTHFWSSQSDIQVDVMRDV